MSHSDSPVATSVAHLVELVQKGDILNAYDLYYADNVSMNENTNPATVGKAENRLREEAFVGSVAEIHENRAASVLVDENKAAIHWILEFTKKEGLRLKFSQIALQTWANGKIVSETFFYDSATVVQK